jgi:hypothetical protein
MMRFTAFPEIQLNPDMRDIGDCRWVKPTHGATITHPHPQGIYFGVGPIPLLPRFNRVSRKAVQRI